MAGNVVFALSVLLLALVPREQSGAATQICPSATPSTDSNHHPDQCGPITTKVVLSGGTLAFFNIPANSYYQTSAINAAYFSPNGFNLEGNGVPTFPAYTGSVAIKAIVPVNGGVDTLFANNAVYFSPNGQNLGGGCTGSVCTVLAYSGGPVGISQIVAAGGGVDAVLAVNGGVENAFFSPNGLNLDGGGNSVSIYNGNVAITQIVPVDSSSVVTRFSNGSAYYSPNNRSIGTVGGGSSTIYAYTGSVAIQQILKIGGGLLTEFSNNSVYLSPNGQNLGGGGSTISVANWVQAQGGPFPTRDSAHGGVFNKLFYLSGGFTDGGNYFDLWSTATDDSGTNWVQHPLEACPSNDSPSPPTQFSYPGCWDSYSPLVVWNSGLWALGSYVYRSTNGTTWVLKSSHNGSTATPAQGGPGENARGLVLGSDMYYLELENGVDVQVTSNPNGTPWTDLHNPSGIPPRCGPAVFVLGSKMWIEGGRDGAAGNCDNTTDYTSDIWSSSDGILWTKASKAPEWAPRQWPCVTTDPSGTAWLVGGYVADFGTANAGQIRYETNLADVWYSKDGLNWKQFKADIGSQLPDDLAMGVVPRHAPICYIDSDSNNNYHLVVVAGKSTLQPTSSPPYTHGPGDVTNDVRILQLPDPSVLP